MPEKRGRGRPVQSIIRQNIVDILYFLKEGYGYELWKIYLVLFPACTLRSIHHHLKKGLETREFIIEEVRKEKGTFSWGTTVEKTYYALGPDAKPRCLENVKEYLDKKSRR